MKKTILLLFISQLAWSQQKYSLSECIKLAKNYSPQASQKSLIEEHYELQKKLLNGAFLPQSSIGALATWQSQVTSLPISFPGVNIQPPPKDQYKITLDVHQNIYDGGLNKAKKMAAEAGQLSEIQKLETELYTLNDQVSSLYFGALLAQKQRTQTELIQSDIRRKIAQMKENVKQGTATNTQILSLEAKVLEIEQQKAAMLKMQNAALEGLQLLTGEPIIDINQIIAEENSATNDSNNRPELRFFEAQKNQTIAGEYMIKAKYAPKIGLFATGGYGRPAMNFLANDFSTYFIGGLQLNIPISHLYAGGKMEGLEQIKLQAARIDKQKEQFLLASEVKIAAQKQEISRLESLLETDQALIVMREKIRETAEVQLNNGIINSTDYLSEINQEDMAKQNQILHQIQLLQAKNGLQILLGNN